MNTPPILYSYRRCPYAMRARLGLMATETKFEWREILLRDKHPEFLALSTDATVPILKLNDQIIQESLDILLWTLAQNDPDDLMLRYDAELVETCDGPFKQSLDLYKYASRHPDGTGDAARDAASDFIRALSAKLGDLPYLHGDNIGASDLAILPFIRQFAHVDLDWFTSQEWKNVTQWLEVFKESPLFKQIMVKQPLWDLGVEPRIFGRISV